MGYSTLRNYGVTLDDSAAGSRKLSFLPYKAGLNTFATSSDWTPGAGDFKICKAVTGAGLGAEASIGTAPTWVNGRVVIILSGTELTCRYADIRIENAAINSDNIHVETFGHASAQYPTIYSAGGAGNALSSGTGADQIQVNGSGAISNVVLTATTTTVTNQLTAAAIATGVWQDATAGDFTVAGSIGKCLYISNVVPGGAGGHFIAGTNAATTITGGLTTHFIGTVDTVTTYTGNTPQTGDAYAIVNSATFGNAKLVRATTPANTLGINNVGAIISVVDVAGSVAGDLDGKVLGGGDSTITGVGAWVLDGSGQSVGTLANQTTLLNRIGAFTGTGVKTILGFLKAIFSSSASTPSDMGGTGTAAADSLQAIRVRGDSAWTTGAGGAGGSGANSCTMTITDSGTALAIPDADVWISSDAAGSAVVAGTLQTNSLGKVTFLLDAGVTYYLWMQKDGENPIRGTSFVAVAD